MNPPLYTTDTSAAALAIQAECFRAMSPAERVRKMCAMSHRGKRLPIDPIRRRHPDLDPDELLLKYIEVAYGNALAADVRRWQRERIA